MTLNLLTVASMTFEIELQLFKWEQYIFSLSYNLTSDFDLDMWPSSLLYKGSHVASMTQVWFQLDFNFSNESNFTFSAYLTTWPQMTFDLNMWPLTSLLYKGSHVASMTQVWFQLDFNFSNESNFTFSAYFKWEQFYIFSLSYNLTSDDLWPWYVTLNLLTM